MESTIGMPPPNQNIEDGEEAQNEVTAGSVTTNQKRKAKGRTPSNARKEYDEIEGILFPDGCKRARCKHCSIEYKADGNTGTKNLIRHLTKCEKYLSTITRSDVDGSIEINGQLPSKLDEETCKDYLCKITIKHGLPYIFVEYEEVRRFLSYLNPTIRHWSRNTHVSNIIKFNAKLKASVKHTLQNLRGRICLTSDIWTSIIGEGYICVTAHYIGGDWILRSKVLSFQHFEPPHTSVIICEKLFELLKDWGIEGKIFSITLDNASSMNNMQSLLCSQLNLRNALVSRGKYFHIRCSAHILNLIVQDGLKVVSGHLKGIRDSVLYVRRSEARKMKFLECAAAVGMNISKSLWLDVPTRWNSTYLMVQRALLYRPVFSQLNIVDPCYEHCPATDEWDKLAKIVKILEPFYDMTTLFSGSDYPTANLYFENIWRMNIFINDAKKDPDTEIREMAQRMSEKFDKYWEDFSMVLTFAVILDPRYKLDFVKFCYDKLGMNSASKYIEVRDQLYSLFGEYEAYNSDISSHLNDVGGVGERDHREIDSFLMDFDQDQSVRHNIKSELDIYLMECRHSIQLKIDVLNFWKEKEARYPVLARMARDILSIPITSVASESTFSMGGKILNKYRNRLLPSNVEALVTSYSWLYGYEVGEYELLHLNGLEVPLNSVTYSEVASSSSSHGI